MLQEFLVTNRAQRCEMHKLALSWWVGGMLLRAEFMLLPFWSRTILRAILKDLPPAQLCVRTCTVMMGAIGSASVQQLYQNDFPSSGRAGGFTARIFDNNFRHTSDTFAHAAMRGRPWRSMTMTMTHSMRSSHEVKTWPYGLEWGKP